MASVSFKITNTRSNFSAEIPQDPTLAKPPYKDGQLIFVEDLGELYLDFHGNRTKYGAGTSPSPEPDPKATHYLGVVTSNTFDTTSGTVEVASETITAKWGDIVTYQNAEYLWNTSTWILIGSGESPSPSPSVGAAMHYLGTVQEEPTTSTVYVDGSSTATTAVNGDVVFFGEREFIFNGTNWRELGEEIWEDSTLNQQGS